MENLISPTDTMKAKYEPKSSEVVLAAIAHAKKTFRTYNDICRRIDDLISAKAEFTSSVSAIGLTDQGYDLFWASMEILKPAIYAKPPKIVVSQRFKDGSKTDKTAADLIERVLNSEFERSEIDQVMLDVRDDLALSNRGVDWVTYEADDGEKRVCIEHLDRYDFLHEPARKWSEVSWVARCAYMTKKQMADRFRDKTGEAYQDADFVSGGYGRDRDGSDDSMKAEVWEVWSKADDRVYWVSEGVDVFLDDDEPHLDLSKGFPCPRPAYGTKTRRSLIPVPDYIRYETLLSQINEATRKIYDLLEMVRVRGLIPSGGDVGSALETALSETSTAMFIPVPSAQLSAGSSGFIQWVPIDVIANTVTGLIQARQQLFDDFYQLSGISDIMRGASEAEETLGAQRLKGQYGSIRIKDKVDEIIRLARDTAVIAAEIICDNFDQKTLLEVSQMTIPTKKDIEKRIKDIQDAAKKEIEQVSEGAEKKLMQAQQQGQEVDPQQAEQQMQAALAQVTQKYNAQLKQVSETVVIEDVMDIIKDSRTRSMIIDVETNSTVMMDEMAEKQSRSEFLNAFASASQAVQPLLMAGETGAKLAGAMLKFSLQPYNANRELDSLIDEFIDQAPQMAAAQSQDQNGQDSAELVAAQNKLAEAEMAKAQAQTMKVQADAQLKMQEIQLNAAKAQAEAQDKQSKLSIELETTRASLAKTQAEIEKIYAEIQAIGVNATNSTRKQDVEEVKVANEIQRSAIDTAFRARSENRADRGEERADRGEMRSDRQQEFSERQSMMDMRNKSVE